MNESYLTKLKEAFGYDTFRDKQLEIIKALLKKKDVCAIMFTGAGKSLCFQFPPIYTNKLAIVISPLISLMNDQCMKMKAQNIPSCCINSEMTYETKQQVLKDVRNNKYRLMYTTPETIIKQQNLITRLFADDILILIAIDEAHCCSSWGNDFRLDYKKLFCLKNWCPTLPIITLTATATEIVQNDIITTLQLYEPLIVKTTFNRDNLFISVRPKTDDEISDIIPLIVEPANKPVIIYCGTRSNVNSINEILQNNGIICDSYHAGMDPKDKEIVHNKFVNNELDCVVATIAFGMGIDKPIRTVVHYCVPMDIESYYQEIGRAGRDGILSNCILFKSNKDLQIDHFIINKIENEDFRDYKMILLSAVKKFINTVECRRKIILEYFGEKYDVPNCGMCDNCISLKPRLVQDFMAEAKIVLSTIKLTGNSYGAGMICNIIRGSKSSQILKKYTQIDEYGKGKHKKLEWWKLFIDLLINHGFIKQHTITGGKGCILGLTTEGNKWLNRAIIGKETKLELPLPEELRKYHVEPNIPVTIMSPNPNLPTDQEELLIQEQFDTPVEHKYTDTVEMFNRGMTIDQIARHANIKPITVENHIMRGYELGLNIDVTKASLTQQLIIQIKEAVIKVTDTQLSSIKKLLPKGISYLQIKLVKCMIAAENNEGKKITKKENKKETKKESKQPGKQANKVTKKEVKPNVLKSNNIRSSNVFSSDEECDQRTESEWEDYDTNQLIDVDITSVKYDNLLDHLKKNLENQDYECYDDDFISLQCDDEVFYESE